MSLFPRRLFVLPAFVAGATLVLAAHGATAQSATGTITGRVVWGTCIRAIPLPQSPDAQAQPGAPAPDSQIQPRPGIPTSGLPAGAVLVAVQSTGVNARTDEAGRFSLSGVPAGQYMTVAAGPVANAPNAIAVRPNVFLNGGQSADVGTLDLGGSASTLGIPCRVLPGVQSAPGTDTQPAPDMAPPPGGSANP